MRNVDIYLKYITHGKIKMMLVEGRFPICRHKPDGLVLKFIMFGGQTLFAALWIKCFILNDYTHDFRVCQNLSNFFLNPLSTYAYPGQ